MSDSPTPHDIRAYVLELSAQLAQLAAAYGEADLADDLSRIGRLHAAAPAPARAPRTERIAQDA